MEVQRTKFDPSKIKGPYGLLGAFLLISEGLLLFWFVKAGDSQERIIAGVLMTLILIVFLLVVLRLGTITEGAKAPVGQRVRKGAWGKVIAVVLVLLFLGYASDEIGYWIDDLSIGEAESWQPPVADHDAPDTPGIAGETPGRFNTRPLASVNLTGTWLGADGLTYVIDHSGLEVHVEQINPLHGVQVPIAQGALSGTHLQLRHLQAGGGTYDLLVQPGGRLITGKKPASRLDWLRLRCRRGRHRP